MFIRRFLFLGSLLSLCAAPAWANERHFTRSNESATLPAGTVEIEPWATARLGRDGYFTGIDNRLEFEAGVTDRLQTALYLNWSGEGARNPVTNGIDTSSKHKGISSEWKLRLTDSVADPIGSALYLEVTLAPKSVEIESKILLDKRVGPWNVVCNAVYEFERNYEESINEHKFSATAGVAYFLAERVSLGLEALDLNVLEPAAPGSPNELKHGAIFAGPVLSYGQDRWWLAASVTPQLFGYGKAVAPGRGLDLDGFERMQARVLMGIHL